MKIHYKFFDHHLDNTDYSVNKILQLYDTKITRHGNMLVGRTMSGKSTTYKILAEAMNSLHEDKPEKYPKVKYYVLNPKSISMQELYGYVRADDQSEIGVFSHLMDQLCNKDESEEQKWIVFDGPIDTKWIESMNSLLDDNKVLTLLDGNRINLHPLVSLIFEVRDLQQASPATVSRCGMVYMDIDKLEWDSIRLKWLLAKEAQGYDEDSLDNLEDFFDKWVEPIMAKKKAGVLKDVIPLEDNALVESLCKMIDSVAIPKNKIDFTKRYEDELFWIKYEKWFVFSMIWTIGCALDTSCRKDFDTIVRDIEDAFPFSQTVFDCYINVEKSEFVKWEDRLTVAPNNWAPKDLRTPDHRFLVETVDTMRTRQLIDIALKSNTKLLLIGTTGTGKTALVNSVLQELDKNFTYNIINLSANTSSEKLQ
jgi:dynein heavy chain, axonemal